MATYPYSFVSLLGYNDVDSVDTFVFLLLTKRTLRNHPVHPTILEVL